MNYQTQIKKAHKLNYSFFLDNKPRFINSYFISRKNLISQINKLLKKKTNKIIIEKDDFTFLALNNIYKKNLHKKKINSKDIFLIKQLYKKFEIFLKLRKKYSKKFTKITNAETNERSYILLYELINKLNIIPLCKLNCQLKLNDKLSINKASTKEISKKLEKLKVKSALIIDSNSNKDDKGFKKSILNITNINLIPVIGMNVHDILKFKNLIISKDALVEVEKRLI